MNQKSIIAVLGVVVVILLGTTIYFAIISDLNQPTPAPLVKQPTTKPPATQPAQTTNATTSPSETGSKVTSLDNQWNVYTNHDLGFSMELPKKVYVGHNCTADGMTELKTFEKKENNIVYVSTDYVIDTKASSKCVKNSLSILDYADVQTSSNYKYNVADWKIKVSNIDNFDQLEELVKDKFGEGCSVDKSTVGAEKDVYAVQLSKKSFSSFEECFGKNSNTQKLCCVNYRHAIKYSPSFKKAAIWTMGQDVNFLLANQEDMDKDPSAKALIYEKAADDRMEKSFQFIAN